MKHSIWKTDQITIVHLKCGGKLKHTKLVLCGIYPSLVFWKYFYYFFYSLHLYWVIRQIREIFLLQQITSYNKNTKNKLNRVYYKVGLVKTNLCQCIKPPWRRHNMYFCTTMNCVNKKNERERVISLPRGD